MKDIEEKLYTVPKDSLKRLVEIMTFVEELSEGVTKEDIEKKFGKDGFLLFQRYCLGGKDPYATEQPEEHTFQILQPGIRKLYELRGILASEKREDHVKWIQIILVTFIIVQAMVSLLLYMRV